MTRCVSSPVSHLPWPRVVFEWMSWPAHVTSKLPSPSAWSPTPCSIKPQRSLETLARMFELALRSSACSLSRHNTVFVGTGIGLAAAALAATE